MKYFIDCEFNEGYSTADNRGRLDLISIAIVAQDGRELYEVASEGWAGNDCNKFVKENVLPNLRVPVHGKLTRDKIIKKIEEFVAEDEAPEFWGYYADYDWVCFCWLFGAMIDLPEGFPMFCLDLKQVMVSSGVDWSHLEWPDTHNALDDAKALRRNHRLVIGRVAE